MFSKTYDLGHNWFMEQRCDSDGIEAMRFYHKSKFSPNEQEIVLSNDSVKKLREIFQSHKTLNYLKDALDMI